MTHADFKDQKPELLVPVEIKEWNHHLPSFVKKMQSWEFQVDTTSGFQDI